MLKRMTDFKFRVSGPSSLTWTSLDPETVIVLGLYSRKDVLEGLILLSFSRMTIVPELPR